MSNALKKTMVMLGLADEEQPYDEDYVEDDYEEPEDPAARRARAEAERAEYERFEERRASVTPMTRGSVTRIAPVQQEIHRISTIHPRSYNEAKAIGETFRDGIPVIMNLTDMDDQDAKRLVDFAAGLVFGLHGSIERVTAKVFLLSPSNVEVAPADQPRATEQGFFNQV